MSTIYIDRAWPLTMPAPRKLVLVALADMASDDGNCWALVSTLVKITGLGDRTVRRALTELEESGLVRRLVRSGRCSDFFLNLPEFVKKPWRERFNFDRNDESLTPATQAPTPATQAPTPATQAPTPATQAPTPATQAPITVSEPSNNQNLKALCEQGSPPAKKRLAGRTRLPEAFTPDATGLAFASERHVAIADALPAFTAHHAAKGSLMADWQAAWRTWCINAVKWGNAGRSAPNARASPRFETHTERMSRVTAELTGTHRTSRGATHEHDITADCQRLEG